MRKNGRGNFFKKQISIFRALVGNLEEHMNLHFKAYNLSFQNIPLEFICDLSNLRKVGLKLPGRTQKSGADRIFFKFLKYISIFGALVGNLEEHMNLHFKAYNLSFQNISLEFVCDLSNLRKLSLKLPGWTQKLTRKNEMPNVKIARLTPAHVAL